MGGAMLHQPPLELSHPTSVWSPHAARQVEQTCSNVSIKDSSKELLEHLEIVEGPAGAVSLRPESNLKRI